MSSLNLEIGGTPLKLSFVAYALVVSLLTVRNTCGQETQTPEKDSSLVMPILLAKNERESGNPLATLHAMRELEDRYLASRAFSKIYPEIRLNYEQFLGKPDAGIRAMHLPALRRDHQTVDVSIFDTHEPRTAIDVICQLGEETRIVIWGEEHHLSQTRSLYEAMLRELWRRGYRYLAAEVFTHEVMEEGFQSPDYKSGYYMMDPVYASAVRTAVRLGYQLIAYDTNERGSDEDSGFRDRKQAENIKTLIFDRDPNAKVLILAGRGHAAETPPVDGWKPMASVLKKLTGIDPLTIYAPTMSERLLKDAEHPWYKYAVDRLHITEPTIFVDVETETPLGFENCDAYVFWPRVTLRHGRPDWLRTTLGRKDVSIPESLCKGSGLRLAQAFDKESTAREIPVDQVLIEPGQDTPVLVLPEGEYWLRVIDAHGNSWGPVNIVH